MSHSKRNTSLAFFTSHEREELKAHWGSKSTRLTRDSFLPFGSCQLCLLSARDPVACPSHGHLFCRECAVSNLLAQNQELKRLKKESERRQLEDEEERNLNEETDKAKALEEFERTQAGFTSNGVKRKRQADVEDGFKHGTGDEKASKRRASDKQGAGEESSFWVPSKIPDNKKADVKTIKAQPTCPAAAADEQHPFTLKTLVAVNFSEDDRTGDKNAPSTAEGKVRACPSCDKALSNSTKAVLAKPCGHVLCKPCSDKFQRPPEKTAHEEHDETVRCYVCQEDVTPGRKVKQKEGKEKVKVERGLVELSSDGTGFAGSGKNMVKRQGVAFQC
ncbi:uncharacterized protein LTR77_001609 [Saxophila tyrrhenica]|uniref:RING-type domain-containing protein n=1 Tax=Saxophila tyrrhenica TaxID=1690608 RepID=A0AAV9PQG5_9PEZI|nr:hypothetical protein LTR77_001609 [Saxophila tyrrhenica]